MSEKNEAATATTFGLMKYVHAMFFAGALIVGWLFVQIVETLWITANLEITWMPPPAYWMVILIGGGVAAILTVYLWRHPKVNRLAVEIVTELSKVTWPTRKELSASTVVVIIVSVIASIILGLFDAFWSWATTLLMKI
jgi:preprotein translocase subunit SecE